MCVIIRRYLQGAISVSSKMPLSSVREKLTWEESFCFNKEIVALVTGSLCRVSKTTPFTDPFFFEHLH